MTGGPWYTDQEFDYEFVKHLSNYVLSYVKEQASNCHSVFDGCMIFAYFFCRSFLDAPDGFFVAFFYVHSYEAGTPSYNIVYKCREIHMERIAKRRHNTPVQKQLHLIRVRIEIRLAPPL